MNTIAHDESTLYEVTFYRFYTHKKFIAHQIHIIYAWFRMKSNSVPYFNMAIY